MSKKSSPFKRRLKAAKFGFRYYRIWGRPIPSADAFASTEKDPSSAVFQFCGTTIRLTADVGYVGIPTQPFSKILVPFKKSFRKRYAHILNGSLLPGCYFRTVAQAQRELALYASGCKVDGLPELIRFHQRMDSMEEESAGSTTYSYYSEEGEEY